MKNKKMESKEATAEIQEIRRSIAESYRLLINGLSKSLTFSGIHSVLFPKHHGMCNGNRDLDAEKNFLELYNEMTDLERILRVAKDNIMDRI